MRSQDKVSSHLENLWGKSRYNLRRARGKIFLYSFTDYKERFWFW